MFVVVDFFHNFKHLFYSKNVYNHVIFFGEKNNRDKHIKPKGVLMIIDIIIKINNIEKYFLNNTNGQELYMERKMASIMGRREYYHCGMSS